MNTSKHRAQFLRLRQGLTQSAESGDVTACCSAPLAGWGTGIPWVSQSTSTKTYGPGDGGVPLPSPASRRGERDHIHKNPAPLPSLPFPCPTRPPGRVMHYEQELETEHASGDLRPRDKEDSPWGPVFGPHLRTVSGRACFWELGCSACNLRAQRALSRDPIVDEHPTHRVHNCTRP